MRYQGKITTWKDGQGFGFISPNGGGPPVFVHIKKFTNSMRRPVVGEIVTYEVTRNEKGQPRAEHVAFNDDRVRLHKAKSNETPPLSIAALFLAFVAASALLGKLPVFLLGLYFVASAATYAAYWADKSAAKSGQWRIRESTLHLVGLVGGWPGALIAQRIFRHKSRKLSFQIVFWICVFLNCGTLGWLFSSSGARAFHAFLGAL
ncbi:cold shock and DUF1294 domain-containing protein [Janthinobacterium sp. 17J80-10]|uniref:DUF1294 domain-containing protein n=1 Tax=Janthinobacterium sp. 17J80-10 TaxID=2497863 RepID=UPI001005707F|nr:cold shock and DUF1294 domain-containing protein [Janthinobacterium sp. 17J80-10]QAU33427.1 DUF1294 domain-containing protein [Janthinobacterium sp. 17J80-10]